MCHENIHNYMYLNSDRYGKLTGNLTHCGDKAIGHDT